MRLAIDIGTHTARAAYLGPGGTPQLVRFASGHTAMSTFARQTMHGLDVGDDAARSLVGNEETTICGCTRLMGRARLLDAELLERLPYTVRDVGGEAWCNLLYDEVRVSDVYGRIAAGLIEAARQQAGQPVESVIVCVPASAEDRFRVQARAAVEANGVYVARLINQPAAALVALEQQRRRAVASHVAVVACGGGATEVSLARRDAQGIRTLATMGDVLLGGEDVVWAAAQALNQRLQRANGVDVFAASQSRAAAYGLRAALEETLSHLAIAPHAVLTLDHGAGFGRDVVTAVSRSDVETWVAPLLEQVGGLCRRALAAARLEPAQVEQVVLIGEWAWLPGIATTVAAAFGQPVGMLHTAHAETLAVCGAALAGAAHAPNVWDVTPYPLGINCYYGNTELFSPIIAANTPIPTPKAGVPGAFTESYQTRFPDQTGVTLSVLQYRGDRNPDPNAAQSVCPTDCEALGTWEWTGLRPKRGRHAEFTVTFTVDADGILHLYAREKATGHSLEVQIEGRIG